MGREGVRWAMIGCVAFACGCSGERSVTGGTHGVLRSATTTELRDVQIHVYPLGGAEPIGFGVTRDGGAFELFQPAAKGPLYLSPGDYAFTLESVGPEPLNFPPEFGDPRRTPIRRSWSADESTLELVAP